MRQGRVWHRAAKWIKDGVMVRNMFNDPEFKKDHYIGLQMEGKLKGSTLERSPAVHQIICGEKPVGDLAGMWYAENGNIRGPEGKVIIFARILKYLLVMETQRGMLLLNLMLQLKLNRQTLH